MAPVIPLRKPEAVASDHGSAVHYDAIAYLNPRIKADVGVEVRVRAYAASLPDGNTRTHHREISDARPVPHMGERPYDNVFPELDAIAKDGARVNAGHLRSLWKEKL